MSYESDHLAMKRSHYLDESDSPESKRQNLEGMLDHLVLFTRATGLE